MGRKGEGSFDDDHVDGFFVVHFDKRCKNAHARDKHGPRGFRLSASIFPLEMRQQNGLS